MSRFAHHIPARSTRRPSLDGVATRYLVLPAALVGVALVLLLATAFAHEAAAAQPARDEAAREAYENGHYDRAFAEFARLADEGHCESARVARQMARHGRTLYGVDFHVAAERLERWWRLPDCPAPRTASR